MPFSGPRPLLPRKLIPSRKARKASVTSTWHPTSASGCREVGFERPPQPGAGAVEQDALVRLADAEDLTGLPGRQPVDVGQRDDQALARRQGGDRRRDLGPCLS